MIAKHVNHRHQNQLVLLEGCKIRIGRHEVNLDAKLPHRAIPVGHGVWITHVLGWHVGLHHDPELLVVIDHGNLGLVGRVTRDLWVSLEKCSKFTYLAEYPGVLTCVWNHR